VLVAGKQHAAGGSSRIMATQAYYRRVVETSEEAEAWRSYARSFVSTARQAVGPLV